MMKHDTLIIFKKKKNMTLNYIMQKLKIRILI